RDPQPDREQERKPVDPEQDFGFTNELAHPRQDELCERLPASGNHDRVTGLNATLVGVAKISRRLSGAKPPVPFTPAAPTPKGSQSACIAARNFRSRPILRPIRGRQRRPRCPVVSLRSTTG